MPGCERIAANFAGGGRSWWAHLTFTRMNIGPIILGNQIEDWMDRMEILEFRA